MNDFEMLIQKTVMSININNLIQAENYLKEAIIKDFSAPQTHNLFGIISEHKEEKLLAIRHYRAAYALDPAYKPARNNLERITTYHNSCYRKFDLVDRKEEKNDTNDYFIEYDRHKVGYIKKRHTE